jgi:hypothetical protein
VTVERRLWPCCDHCEDDQPHIKADTHKLPCTVNGCQALSDNPAELSAMIVSLRADLAEALAARPVDDGNAR